MIKLLYFTCVVGLIIFDLLLEDLPLLMNIWHPWELSHVTLIFDMDCKLGYSKIDPSTGSRTLKDYHLLHVCLHRIDLIRQAQFAIFIAEHFTCSKTLVWVFHPLGTLIAGESFADGTLAGRDGKLLADSTDQEV